MSTVTVSGLPALAWQIGFVVIGIFPVWLAAKVIGASQATLLRCALALIAGTVLAFIGLFVAGGLGLLIVPLAYLLAFKFILDTSFLGAIALAILALAGYTAMSHLIGGGISFS
jgi:hypothetical protein